MITSNRNHAKPALLSSMEGCVPSALKSSEAPSLIFLAPQTQWLRISGMGATETGGETSQVILMLLKIERLLVRK